MSTQCAACPSRNKNPEALAGQQVCHLVAETMHTFGIMALLKPGIMPMTCPTGPIFRMFCSWSFRMRMVKLPFWMLSMISSFIWSSGTTSCTNSTLKSESSYDTFVNSIRPDDKVQWSAPSCGPSDTTSYIYSTPKSKSRHDTDGSTIKPDDRINESTP